MRAADSTTSFTFKLSVPLEFRMEMPEATTAPDALCCPISMEIMRDPVIAADGHTYERADIELWFANNNTSPKTG